MGIISAKLRDRFKADQREKNQIYFIDLENKRSTGQHWRPWQMSCENTPACYPPLAYSHPLAQDADTLKLHAAMLLAMRKLGSPISDGVQMPIGSTTVYLHLEDIMEENEKELLKKSIYLHAPIRHVSSATRLDMHATSNRESNLTV